MAMPLATSICNFNHITDYWCKTTFLGNNYFTKTMSRNDFQNIRCSLKFYPPESYTHDGASRVPIWHSREILEHFMQNSSTIAVTNAVSSLDEMSVCCSVRTSAKNDMPLKPHKFGIRFYSTVEHSSRYRHTIVDNRSGNRTGVSPLAAH